MNSFDPSTIAQQLATSQTTSKYTLYAGQKAVAQAKMDAYNSIETQVDALQKSLEDIISKNNLRASGATLSEEGIATVSADAGSAAAVYSVEVTELASVYQSDLTFTSETWTTPSTGNLDLTVDGETMSIDLSGVTDLSDLRDKINEGADNPGIQAAIIRTGSNVRLTLTGKETGAGNDIIFTYTSDGSTEGDELATAITGRNETAAKDAALTINNIPVTSSSNTINNAVDGLNITLQSKTEVAKPLTITVARDDTSIKESLQSFVDSYNTLLAEYNTQSSSSEDGSAILSGDGSMRSMISSIRNEFYNIEGGISLTSLGIETSRDGTLSIDSTRLTEALDKDETILEQALLGDNGLFTKLEDKLDAFTKTSGIFDQKDKSLQSTLDRVADKEEALNTRYDTLYQRYLAQFTRLQSIQTQMSQTSSLF